MRRFEYHCHTSLSHDGTWSPLEMIREARARHHAVLALTDHVSVSNVEAVLESLQQEREAARLWSDGDRGPIEVFVGVEITHVPASQIARLARQARQAGAEIVLVHGETLAEPVEPGTNRAALACTEVDVLAHPGLLRPEEARWAAERGIYLELSARKGHALTNGLVARLAREAGARLIVNADAHTPDDLIDPERALQIARGSGLSLEEARRVVEENAIRLYESVRERAGS